MAQQPLHGSSLSIYESIEIPNSLYLQAYSIQLSFRLHIYINMYPPLERKGREGQFNTKEKTVDCKN
jgi:hypothetical protein